MMMRIVNFNTNPFQRYMITSSLSHYPHNVDNLLRSNKYKSHCQDQRMLLNGNNHNNFQIILLQTIIIDRLQ